jgi:hypothetical protein
MIVEWMIVTEIGCSLRPLGIVLNEQHRTESFILTPNSNIEHTILFSQFFLFILYEPLWSSSGGFGEDYPRSGSAQKNSPNPQIIMAL